MAKEIRTGEKGLRTMMNLNRQTADTKDQEELLAKQVSSSYSCLKSCNPPLWYSSPLNLCLSQQLPGLGLHQPLCFWDAERNNKKQEVQSWAWQPPPVTPAFRRSKQEDYQFKAVKSGLCSKFQVSLGYPVRHCLGEKEMLRFMFSHLVSSETQHCVSL